MRSLRETALHLAAVAALALATQGCATAPADPQARADRNAAGQSALQGMENSVLKDNNPDTPVKAKPASY